MYKQNIQINLVSNLNREGVLRYDTKGFISEACKWYISDKFFRKV